ncbi:MAG: ferredoxin [Candidatus Andersenbacteria bacterium]
MSKQKTPTAQPTQQGTTGDLRVVVLHSRCIGAAICVKEAAGSFVLNDKNKALVSDLTKNRGEVILNAARNCPTQAIYLYRGSKQIWPPTDKAGVNKQPGREIKMSFEPD